MTDKPMKKYRKPRCALHEWDDPESGASYCVNCGVDERDYDDIRDLEAKNKRLADEFINMEVHIRDFHHCTSPGRCPYNFPRAHFERRRRGEV